MRKVIVLLPFILLFAISSQSTDQENKGAEVSSEKLTAESMLSTADDTFQSRQYEKALADYQAAYEKARDEFNRSVEVESLSQLARMNLILGNKDEGRKLLDQAKERVEQSDSMGYSRYLSVKGRFEWKDNNLVSARETFTEMFEYSKSKSLWGRTVDAANMMGIVSEDLTGQIEWCKKGIDAAEMSDNKGLLGALWNNLAACHYDLKDFEQALECYQKSREYHWRFSGEVAKLFADYHIGMTYRHLGNCDEALGWLRPVLAWAERLGNNGAIGQACEDIAECAVLTGDKVSAVEYFKRARDEYKKAGYNESWPEVWENINKRIAEVEG